MMVIAMRAMPYLLAIAVVLGALYGAYSHGVDTERTAWQARTNKALAEAMAMAASEQAKARDAEQASAQAMSTIDHAYQQGRDDAQTEYDRTAAERDAGAIRLRDRFSCPASSANGLPEAGTSASKRDATSEGGLQRKDEEFLVREAKRADDAVRQLHACQAVLRERAM